MSKIDDKFPRGIEVVSSALIVNDEGKILFAQSPEKWSGKWTIPGGHIEPGESIIEAALREGEEEIGYKLSPVTVINWGELINSEHFHRPAHFIFFHVLCKIVGGEEKVDQRELSICKFFTPEEALELDLGEGFADTIQKFIEYSNKV